MKYSNNTPIEELIQRLGYYNSPNLLYLKNLKEGPFTFHTNKVLFELQPYAVYCVDDKPFITFFEIDRTSNLKELNNKIWNAQIPIAIFCTENTVEIYNGTSLNINQLILNKIHEESISECSVYSPFSYWKVTNGEFWNKHSSQFNQTTINELLLQNIDSITKQLKEKHNISFATKLILRIIFIRFLIDRGVDLGYKNFSNNVAHSQAEFLKVVKSKEQLYDLFYHLKRKFNGNLFEMGKELEDIRLTSDVFELISRFLSGKEMINNGQLALFPMYDFNIIPVELISNIFEIMLGKETQKQEKAFYTPHYLVDFIVKQTIIPFLKNNDYCKVLDPSCGSGIFLVECYRQIMEKKLHHMTSISDDLLINTLKENIFGIDMNEDAIDITIFSLYLVMLDYKDPKSLDNFKLPDIKNKNLVHANFLTNEKPGSLKNISFDFILGNPPWGRDTLMKHKSFCEIQDFLEPSEVSKSFVYKVKDYCNSKTQCCLVLPSKILYNKKNKPQKFREFLLRNTKIRKITELSSVVDLVFKNAKVPAIIMNFMYANEHNLSNEFTHISIKPNIFFKLFNIMVIEKNDIKSVKQSLVLENDWAWKTLVYGTSWDFEIIKNLKRNFKTVKDRISNTSIKYGTGIQDGKGEQDTSILPVKRLFNSEGNIDHFFINLNENNFEEIRREKIHRVRNPELFDPPYCLVTKGINPHNYKMRAVYTEEQFLYKETIFGMKGEVKNKDLLIALVGIINSSLYAYLNLILGSSAGIDRRQRFAKELLDYPFPNSNIEEIVSLTTQILDLRESKGILFNNQNEKELEDKISKLDNLILKAFGLEDNPFIDYALNIMIPQIVNARQPEKLQYRSVTINELENFGLLFLEYFEGVYGKLGKHIRIKLYPKLANNFSAIELFVLDEPSENRICHSNDSLETKEFLSKLSIYKFNENFYQIRDVIYFEENSFFIIKTNERKNWHPAAAQMDLSDVIDRILSETGGGQ